MQGVLRDRIVNAENPGRLDKIPNRVRMQESPGRPDIVNAGSGETRYSECRVRGHLLTNINAESSGISPYMNTGSLGYSDKHK
ncbi:unnamed protein product [Staurois parvus]|uniref:Uncharacterized protein n=1 Tax=Staurois parvus TaxID=386267 RepID=A0ABN9CYH8_9NEOB|nr:unnamed protein product [Staurois parvus]